MNEIQQTEIAPQPQYWPEDVRTESRQDKFPWKPLVMILLPGALAIILLLILIFWLSVQANRHVVYVDQNGQINAIQANRENPQTLGQPPLQLNETAQEEVENLLPVLAWPEWSADGRKLAATISVNDNVQTAVFNPISQTTTVLSSLINGANKVIMPGNGWSPNSTHLALLETDDAMTFLSLVDISQEEPIVQPVSVSFDARGGFDWHPTNEQLIVTTLPDGSSASTLHIVDASTGQVRPFIPKDNNFYRTSAVWSPNGESIAYIVPALSSQQEDDPYAGALWVADDDGSSARELVADNLNMAPIWHEVDHNFIYFTRPITSANNIEYGLYKIRIDGLSEPEFVSESYETFLAHPFDQDHYLSVAEDSHSLLLNDSPTPATNQFGWTPDSVIRNFIQQSVPILGVPIWSPDGRFLATTNWQDGKIAPRIYNANLQDTTPIGSAYDVMTVPASGWANDGSAVALIESDNTNAYLALFAEPFKATNMTLYDFFLDSRAGIHWNPLEPKLLVTAHTNDIPTPTLYIAAPGALPQPLTPNDGLALHADAAWSPDGSQIAYIATDVYTSGQDILHGALWIADSNGDQARPLLADAQIIAPVWNATGDAIYYTQVSSTLGPFALYRIAVDGATPPEYIGPGSEQLALYPLDRNRFIQWSKDGQQLLFASQELMPPLLYKVKALNTETLAQIQENLPVLGVSSWSPNRIQFAGTLLDQGNVKAAIYKTQTAAPIYSPETDDMIVVPANGWSPDSTYIALLRHDGTVARLAIMDTNQSSLGTAQFPLDMRAGLSWQPGTPQIMATSLDEGITPTLRSYNAVDNSALDFVPEDNQAVHADGVWSPDGHQIAYITQETITPTLDMDFLAGALWVADSAGKNARQLVPDGLNFAPIWDISENQILFTRYLTETNSFAMYQVSLTEGEEEALASYYGPSSAAFAAFPFDRQSFLHWSPEGMHWQLPGSTRALPFEYYQRDKEGAVNKFATNCQTTAPFTINWAPNNRGALVSCPLSEMELHWTDFQRDSKEFPIGLYPSWQP